MPKGWASFTNSAAASTDADLISEPTQLFGFSAVETGGANPGTVILRNGVGDNLGEIIFATTLAAGAAATVTTNIPIRCMDGVRLERQGTGTTEVTAFHEAD